MGYCYCSARRTPGEIAIFAGIGIKKFFLFRSPVKPLFAAFVAIVFWFDVVFFPIVIAALCTIAVQTQSSAQISARRYAGLVTPFIFAGFWHRASLQ